MGFSRSLALLVVVVLVLVGCGGDDDASPGSLSVDEPALGDGGEVAKAGDDPGDQPAQTSDEGGSDSSGEDDRGPVVDEEWTIAMNGQGGGIYTLVMIKTFSPLVEADIEDLGGRLVWEETEIELCRIGIRSIGDGFVQIGDIFRTTEGCDGTTGMQQAFDDFGPPETACVYVRVDGVDDEYCAPLTVGTAEVEFESLDQPSLAGVWTGTEVGRATGPWVFAFDERSVSVVSSGAEVYEGTYVAFPDEDPKRMEFAVTGSIFPDYVGETARAIYAFDGTTLILASNEPGVADTPTGFSPGGGARVWELTQQ